MKRVIHVVHCFELHPVEVHLTVQYSVQRTVVGCFEDV